MKNIAAMPTEELNELELQIASLLFSLRHMPDEEMRLKGEYLRGYMDRAKQEQALREPA